MDINNNDVKHALLCRHDIPSGCLVIEKCKSENCDPTMWEMVAELWNDPGFTPTTKELSDLHSDILVEEEISFDCIQDTASATPEKCKEKLNSVTVQLNCVITKWKRSGQGDGGVDVTENDKGGEGGSIHEFCSLKNCSHHALDQWRSCVLTHQSYMLYLWHILDKHRLIRSSMQKLKKQIASRNGGYDVHSVVNSIDEFSNDSASASEGIGGSASKKSKYISSDIQLLSKSILKHGT